MNIVRLEVDAYFMVNIITEDESWDYGYDPETKMQGFSKENV